MVAVAPSDLSASANHSMPARNEPSRLKRGHIKWADFYCWGRTLTDVGRTLTCFWLDVDGTTPGLDGSGLHVDGLGPDLDRSGVVGYQPYHGNDWLLGMTLLDDRPRLCPSGASGMTS